MMKKNLTKVDFIVYYANTIYCGKISKTGGGYYGLVL